MTVNVQRQSNLRETLGEDADQLLAAAAVYHALNWKYPDPPSAKKRVTFAGGKDLMQYAPKGRDRKIERRIIPCTPANSVRNTPIPRGNLPRVASSSVQSTPRHNQLPGVKLTASGSNRTNKGLSQYSLRSMASPPVTCQSTPRRNPRTGELSRQIYSASTIRTPSLPARSVDVATRQLMRTYCPDSPTYKHLPTANRQLLTNRHLPLINYKETSCSTPTGLYKRFQSLHGLRNSATYPFEETSKKVKSTLQEPSCFTISFRNNSALGETDGYYDPCSEVNSDYYTVQKVYTQKKLASIPQLTTLNGLLSGKAKILHGRRQEERLSLSGSITSTASSPRSKAVSDTLKQ
ncbi:uncharacterized protein LOC135482755 [Lineus longissimus]|uniref:uncharacterized protein LOC135482755 n=1 Tax=Lineus longissimus TaxID=88925 RepID=UPI00315C6405